MATCRPRVIDLTPVQAAWNMQRRKDLLETLHPKTVNGAIGNGREKVRQFGEATSGRFTADTAAHTGRLRRAVQRDAERSKALSADPVPSARPG